MTRILVIDNFDSFVYTLNGYLQQLGADTEVVRNNTIAPEDAQAALEGYDGVLLSPGPGAPADAGVSIAMVHAAIATGTPLLGVCLGHQSIAEAMGATVTHADELMHGKVSTVTHDGSQFYDGVPVSFTATRYHSLAVVTDTVPETVVVNSATASGVIMGLRHRDAEVYGVQFHPESVLTEGGYNMLGNWLEVAGLRGAGLKATTLSPLMSA
ncbi:anthranilate synthase component II [Lysinibacter cavernae]|uniref:Para-aminobenzoate synthetase component 2 n=1 Tax=Lysinibacter cavernae TaxID=1640652 RepID=A0A7X5R2V2_9MICO|nr:gamma-glutamyl-gamma-aminobutyrate hydrolase family protein [Lysinibacter cavernae]NIH54663.1 para-aminobenzoate synthetase component 2 [Lysinibacter cavernae]